MSTVEQSLSLSISLSVAMACTGLCLSHEHGACSGLRHLKDLVILRGQVDGGGQAIMCEGRSMGP
ncbi:hypothetical protein L7F22_022086, partial [Adiantum nelumboides]|nr:hypothetical protein [Adiantum nelumboides]